MSKSEHSPYIRSADDPVTLSERPEKYTSKAAWDDPGVYILELEDGKFYVGASRNVEERLEEHFEGDDSPKWTSIYEPVAVHDTFPLDDSFSWKHVLSFENQHTKRLMREYGVENVRGGVWAHPDLDKCPEPSL